LGGDVCFKRKKKPVGTKAGFNKRKGRVNHRKDIACVQKKSLSTYEKKRERSRMKKERKKP